MNTPVDTATLLRWRGEALLALAQFVQQHPHLPTVPWVAEAIDAGAVRANLRHLNGHDAAPATWAQVKPILTTWAHALGVQVETVPMRPDLYGDGVFLARVYAWIGPHRDSSVHLYYLHDPRDNHTPDPTPTGGAA
jgi:hypothetical protein